MQKEFNDGTVVDKVLIAKNHPDKSKPAIFYLVGYGLKNGQFRSIAYELARSEQGGLYLSRISERHVCFSTSRCKFCTFTTAGNRINGCECTDATTTNTCDHTSAVSNNLFAD